MSIGSEDNPQPNAHALEPGAVRPLAIALGLGLAAIAAIALTTGGSDSPSTEVAGQTEVATSTEGVATVATTSPAPIAIEPRLVAPATTTATEASSTTVAVPATGSGTFTYTTRPERYFGDPESPDLIRFSVAVEDDIDVDPDELADFVDLTLSDERSWIGFGGQAFERIESGGLFTLVVATPNTVDELCEGLDTGGRYSCARNGWVAINLDRWMNATDFWDGTRTDYRHYVVNHEIGHYLGVQHVPCPREGELAPIMQQQTVTLDGCIGNGWPYPELAPD
ncbi:MAG: DUF3152 domain-containing protein [Acidimicrobiales bacterium]|nr:DUF3152 domain-containing protein [Acidimicrobiales bacterium]